MAAVKEGSKPLNYAYSLDESIEEKIQDVNTKVYGGQDVSYSSAALKDLAKIKALNMGFEKLPICIAKTPFSMSHDPDLKGAPHGFTLRRRFPGRDHRRHHAYAGTPQEARCLHHRCR